jgi:hypothetical protein
VVDADSTRLALTQSRAVSEVSRRLAADVVASLGAHVRPDGSVLWEFTARDLSAVPSHAVRTFVHQVPAGRPLDRAARSSRRLPILRDMDRALRREGLAGPLPGASPGCAARRPGSERHPSARARSYERDT